MRKSRFTESQIVGILKELKAGVKAATICRKHGISGATLYNWRAKYGGLEVSDLRRLKERSAQARSWARADQRNAVGAESAMVAGFCSRSPLEQPALSDPRRR
jgi:putative transposase